jgi:hypothetical protein
MSPLSDRTRIGLAVVLPALAAIAMLIFAVLAPSQTTRLELLWKTGVLATVTTGLGVIVSLTARLRSLEQLRRTMAAATAHTAIVNGHQADVATLIPRGRRDN